MARSCGIRIGPRRFELVVLEGNSKKHRITAFVASEFPQGGEDAFDDAAHALKEAAREHHIPYDSTAIAIDSGLAAFRTLKLPALDQDKIAQVLKFEVEGQLPQWSIDEVVVDFLPLEGAENETNLLVTAVPKVALKRELELCARAGIEPLEAELEATAMVNAALSADICHADDAQVLVHIGETSTAVVIMDAGRVRSMRAIHIGALASDAVVSAEAAATEAAATEAAATGDAAAPTIPADPDELQRRLEQAVSRIRRELGRTLSGARTANPIDAVYVCGWELPDLVGTQILDVPVYELDVFEEDGGQPAQGTGPLVVAYGVALRQLGAAAIPASLRREELRYTGAFERIELPLAVAALMLATWLSVFNIFELRQLRLRSADVDLWRQSSNNFMLGDPKAGAAGNLEQPWDELQRFVEHTNDPKAEQEYTRFEQMQQVSRRLGIEVDKLNRELGNTGEIKQPQSALEGLALVADTLFELGDQVGHVAVRKVHSQYVVGGARGPDTVQIQLDLSFYADTALQATRNWERFASELRSKPWVVEVDPKGSKEFDDNTGIFSDGFSINCDLSKVVRGTVEEGT